MRDSPLPRLLAGALGVSALILTMAWYLGAPGPVAAPREAATLDGEDLPGRFDADPDATRENPLQSVERTTFLTEQDGKLTALSWDVLTPRTDFVSDVEGPRARVELGPGRLLVLEAAEGTVEHPGNDFQRGNFRGGTVATFHRLDDPSAAVSDATAVLRLALDAPTTFDRELGRLTTAGPVRVTGPRVDLAGEGLELDFSRAEEEVKKLVLDRTDRLRLRQESGGSAASAGGEADDEERPSAAGVADTGPTAAAEDEPPAPRPTLYRVEASGEVRVEADRGLGLAGESLVVFFAAEEGLSPGGDAPRPAGSGTADRGPARPDAGAVRGGAIAAETGAPGAPEEAGSLFRPGPGTVGLSWTGPLRLRPAGAEEGPEEVRDPGFRGAHLRLLGTEAAPATARSGPASLAADALAYATASGRLLATGGPGRPVVAEDPAAGRLTAVSVRAEPDAGVAVAQGPGQLRASDPDAREKPDASGGEALRVSFQDEMELGFDPAAEGAGPGGGVVLRRAVFTGSVEVVAATPADAGDAGDAGDVGAAGAGAGRPLGAGGGRLTLEASRVTLALAPPAEDATNRRPAPESLLATGGVVASRDAAPAADGAASPPAWTLRSEDLRVALAPSADDPTRPEIDGLEATGGVTVDAAGVAGEAGEADAEPAPPLRLTADRLVASPRLDRVELNGLPGRPRRRRAGRGHPHRRRGDRRPRRRPPRGPRPRDAGPGHPRNHRNHRKPRKPRKFRRRGHAADLDRVAPLRRRHRRGRGPRGDAHDVRGPRRATPDRGRRRDGDLRARERRRDRRRLRRRRLRLPPPPPGRRPRRRRRRAGGGGRRDPRPRR